MRTDILQQAQAIRASMDAAALEPWQAGTSTVADFSPGASASRTATLVWFAIAEH